MKDWGFHSFLYVLEALIMSTYVLKPIYMFSCMFIQFSFMFIGIWLSAMTMAMGNLGYFEV